jgi:23S rRNA pseudouridine1911/1915/1917 synthase
MIRTGKKFSKPEMSRVINGDTVLPEAEAAPEKVRLDILMKEIYKSYNRSTIQKFIESGFVTVDGELVLKPNFKVERGVKIDLKVPEIMKNADLKPEIVYEDENVLVVNKPSGLLSEAKGEYCPEKTLADYGLIAHRLDRDTSGVMILAKSPEVQSFLKKQFQDRKVHKTYYAVISGRPKLDEARIDLPMIRDLKRPTTFRVDANGKEAETFYKVLLSDGVHSLVELRPTSGRTHQLRVHMKYLGHPIVGDVVYDGEAAERLMLHAGSLEITLPGGVRKTFIVERPREFDTMIDTSDEIAKG